MTGTKLAGPSLSDFLHAGHAFPARLHLGCGGERRDGFVNVDLYPQDDTTPDSSRSGCVADAFADMRLLGLPDGCVSEIFTSHTLEHFTRWEAVDMLTDWYRMCVENAVVVIETPDFWRCVLWLFHPLKRKRQLARSQFYGNQWDGLDYETHRYVWAAGELRRLLLTIGFRSVRVSHQTESHHPGRDMRVVAKK